MIDPYAVLGVSRNASDSDIKKAYRNLSRKYHPDANINSPNKDYAEEKFKEVQAAYNQIMDERQNGSSPFGSSSYSNRSSYSYGYSESATDSNEMRAAANYINSRHFREAMVVLMSISDNARNAKWNFFAAVASQGLGNINDARQYIERAVIMDPSNIQYRQFQQSLNWSAGWYTHQTMNYGFARPYAGVSRWCASVLLLNLLCNCCCFGSPLWF